ncbi:VWA domain-containing protein [Actinotalea ferrariae]|uniref:VWA domain-containing protein n=1 Tax=Actinotalea ferrariae TaxID=1386098 RepID=UPI001C8C1771|nr:VWA domain-containing protein [Actinotalea ferrariae]MBX9245989.1 VWA domain-containing protein [Actinotalea ferrariae]
MTLRPLIPVWILLLVLLPALVFAVREALHARGGVRRSWFVRAGAVAAVTAIGLGPSVPTTTDEQLGVAVDVFFVVDRTGSMAAEDWSDERLPRLDGMRHDLPGLVAAVPGARYSIIAWDSQASRQLPLTTDARAVRSWAQTARQEITAFSSGSLVDRPLEPLQRALVGAAERDPGHVRLVFFLSDGEQTTDGEPASYEAVADLVDGGAVLGYGTAEGGPMRSYDGALEPDPEAPYIVDDATGEQAVSRIDEAALQAVAEQLGVPYVHRTGPDDVAGLVEGLDPEEIASDGRRDTELWQAVTWPLALVVAALLGVEAWTTARGWAPLRRRRAS